MRNIIILFPILFSISGSAKYSLALKPSEGFAGKNASPYAQKNVYFPTKLGDWCYPPKVNICRGNDIKKNDVREAIAYLGEDVLDVNYVHCDCSPGRGTIQIGRTCQIGHSIVDDPSQIILGLTALKVSDRGNCIEHALVDIYDDQALTLTHELGHSFGWSHTILPNHLMNPGDNPGWSTLGME